MNPNCSFIPPLIWPLPCMTPGGSRTPKGGSYKWGYVCVCVVPSQYISMLAKVRNYPRTITTHLKLIWNLIRFVCGVGKQICLSKAKKISFFPFFEKPLPSKQPQNCCIGFTIKQNTQKNYEKSTLRSSRSVQYCFAMKMMW